MGTFDARAAKGLQAGAHLTVDTAPGLRLVASATRRTWTYRYKSPTDGRMRQVKLGEWPAMSYTAALAAWERARAARAEGVDLASARREKRQEGAAQARGGRFTVARACSLWLESYAGTVAPKTYAEAARLIARDAAPIAHLVASAVTRGQAFELIHGMRDRPVVAAGLRRVLGAVWDHALDAGRLPPDTPNWWRLILRGKLPSRGKRIGGVPVEDTRRSLTAPELASLLRWLPNFSRDVCEALTLYLWTCCRGAEICSMERDEISNEAGAWWWTIPRRKLKMRRNPLTVDLRIPLVGRALAIVQRRLQAYPEGPWLFPSRGRSGHVEQRAIGVAVWYHMPYSRVRPKERRPRLTVTHWAPHDLRRTMRTMLTAWGCPDGVAEAMLGHLPPGIMGVYNRHRYDEERRHWAGVIDRRLEELAAQPPAALPAPGAT